MRHLLTAALLALSAAALAGCDELGLPAPAQTATATTQCVPAPVAACPGAKARTVAVASRVQGSSVVTRHADVHTGGGQRMVVREHVVRLERHGDEGGHYARVEHYGYVDGGDAGHETHLSGARVSVSGETRYSERREMSESSSGYEERSAGSSSAGGYGYESSGGYGYRSGGHQGRLVIRGGHGQADSWTWRTAGRDQDGYLTWPGKTPD